MKFTKILVAAYALLASVGAMAVDAPGGNTGLGTPVDDLALLGLAVAALAAGVGIIRRKK
jgi:LPXTG-motif cell wall-anchored protein